MKMANVSTARKLGIAARILAEHAGRSRTLSAVLKAGRATGKHLGRVLHQLWLEVTGFVFLALALIGGSALVREVVKYRAGDTPLSRVLTAVCFTLLFGWFGVSSFWRVWKKS
jgi:hypothetical protein